VERRGISFIQRSIISQLTVDNLSVVDGKGLDKALSSEFLKSDTGERAVQLETIDQDGLTDELVGRHFLEETFIGRLVQNDHVVGLVLDLLGGPLLLGLLST
jgi:hypothetical protein